MAGKQSKVMSDALKEYAQQLKRKKPQTVRKIADRFGIHFTSLYAAIRRRNG